MTSRQPIPYQVLLVEDNPSDAMLAEEGFKELELDCRLNTVETGLECLAYLHREGGYAAAPRPDLILLDLNLPGMNGKEVMRAIRAEPSLRHYPVVVLTNSRKESDVADMYDLGCNAYIVKPVDFEEFLDVLSCLGDYWFRYGTLPPRQAFQSP